MFSLRAKIREVKGKKVSGFRKRGLVPAVCYGHKTASRPLTLSLNEFKKVYQQAGESSLIDLIIDKEKPAKVLIYDLQKNPVTDEIIHIDFYQIKAGEKITVEINLKFIGQSELVKEGRGTLLANMNKLEVECLPENLVSEIEVDISALKNFDDVIRVKDIKTPKELEVKVDPEEVVVMIERPRTEEELKEELEAKPEEAEVSEEVKEEKEEKEEEVMRNK